MANSVDITDEEMEDSSTFVFEGKEEEKDDDEEKDAKILDMTLLKSILLGITNLRINLRRSENARLNFFGMLPRNDLHYPQMSSHQIHYPRALTCLPGLRSLVLLRYRRSYVSRPFIIEMRPSIEVFDVDRAPFTAIAPASLDTSRVDMG
ncbi:hypothetical protein MHU86_20907 [Fragilaria crotonensis]|nr:hypothetical protein MHU86_20907 [Fragilaria crotonensis]